MITLWSLTSFQFALDREVLVFIKLGWSGDDEIDKVSSAFDVMQF